MLIGHQPKEFLLAVEALTVSFDGFKAVNDLSFYVEENEIRVIIGPNGAGKTTVLDLICGYTDRTDGLPWILPTIRHYGLGLRVASWVFDTTANGP